MNDSDDTTARKFLAQLEAWRAFTWVNPKDTLGLVITRSDDMNVTIDCYDHSVWSDHFAILFHLSESGKLKSRNWAEINIQDIKAGITAAAAGLGDAIGSSAVAVDDYNIGIARYSGAAYSLCEAQSPPMYIDDIQKEKQLGRCLERKWRRTGCVDNRAAYRKKILRLNGLCDQRKTEYYTEKVWGATSQKDVRTVWPA